MTIRFELEACVEELDDELAVEDIIARANEFSSVLSKLDFYRDNIRFLILYEGDVIFDEYPLFPLSLAIDLIESWRDFCGGGLFFSIGEEQLCWIFRAKDRAVEFFAAPTLTFDRYQPEPDAWSYFKSTETFEEILKDGAPELMLAMDSWSWINGIQKIGSKYSELAKLGLTLHSESKMEAGFPSDSTLKEMENLVVIFADQSPQIESWLRSNAQSEHWIKKGQALSSPTKGPQSNDQSG